MTMLLYGNDDRFPKPSFAVPLTFLIMFVIFIYGALLMGLLGLSNWKIHTYNLTFLENLGLFGTFLLAFSIIAAWILFAFIIAAIPYFFIRFMGRYMLAVKVRAAVLIFMFNIFAFPWILWRMVRRASPFLRHRRIAKLRKMAKGNKMKLRLKERHDYLVSHGYQF